MRQPVRLMTIFAVIATTLALPVPADAALKSTTSKCSSLVIIGARGSGQSMSSGSISGFGPEVTGSVKNMVSRIKRTGTYRYVGVSYPAIPVDRNWTTSKYFASVGKGAKFTMDTVKSIGKSCSSTKFALIGYSQGASVMRWAIRDLPSTLQARVLLVGMIADPERRGFNTSPSDIGFVENYDSGTLYGSGLLGAGPKMPSGRSRAVVQFCHKNDNVCNRPGNSGVAVGDWGKVDTKTHGSFYKTSSTYPKTGLMLYVPLANYGGFR
ncbi:cutinase family protein [Aeromicrobium sp. A1-2]|uniref:cutinase family protein n=1 Tax=Aeromicrobium sp. A1-2 TaxID=2107713 RepID=UPI0013C34580|nr:cutinase family protein [Aeromicrobium sp. A1-2]